MRQVCNLEDAHACTAKLWGKDILQAYQPKGTDTPGTMFAATKHKRTHYCHYLKHAADITVTSVIHNQLHHTKEKYGGPQAQAQF